ncbi:hypothetical protein B0J18DRAFT_111845 [Chaetomium sp. MPI-SDFR-AT-0129]|nr:hypothetical protein B0J18DRAFT_111845 [Chaetomium sp. MPI-SDFR-AT-0129]
MVRESVSLDFKPHLFDTERPHHPSAHCLISCRRHMTTSDRYLMSFTDRRSGYSWDYYLEDCKASTILAVFRPFFKMLRVQHKVCDNEIVQIRTHLSK